MIKPKFLIGSDDFRKMITESQIFVDKTMLIKEVLESNNEAMLITRPRRWGKTTNMSMLKYFFAPELDKNSNIVTENSNKAIFENLKIGQKCPEIITEYQGKYPVIFISFKDIRGNNYEEIISTFQDKIASLFLEHDYLIQKENKKNLINKFEAIIAKKCDIAQLFDSLRFLSQLLHQYHGTKPYILIDEYDAPLINAYGAAYFQEILNLVRNLLSSALKTNSDLQKAILTGVFRVAKAQIFSGLNNFEEFSVLDWKFAKYFGFTENELNWLFDHPDIEFEDKLHTKKQAKNWYNGYNIAGLTIYNPWSIMRCLSNKGKLEPYWLQTGSDKLLRQTISKQSDDIQEKIQSLANGKAIKVILSKHISFEEIEQSGELGLWSLLLFSGYLTVKECQLNEFDLYYNCLVLAPNNEVKRLYSSYVREWVNQILSLNYTECNNFINYLLEGNIEGFEEKLCNYLRNSTSYYHTGKNAEVFYHGFMIGIASIASASHYIDSERESGKGRADLILIPKPESKMDQAIIMEFKTADNSANIASEAEQALSQITEKNYAAKAKEYNHVKSIMFVGISFYGKDVGIKFKKVAVI